MTTHALSPRLQRAFRYFGYEIRRAEAPARAPRSDGDHLPSIKPFWPLPRKPGGPSDEAIRAAFARFDLWHYAHEFEGGLSFAAAHHHPGPHSNDPTRPLKRFAHFMPPLVKACGGSLAGKRVLDIACNSGFWSIQCALLGADVVGFDSRPELIEQADLVNSIVGATNVEFKVLDFWSMSPQALGGTFDVVLNLGILYHLPEPVSALRLTRDMARERIVLDTAVSPAGDASILLDWEEAHDVRSASSAGLVAYPSRGAIDLILRHIGASRWSEIPIRTDVPRDYRRGKRASWIIEV